MIGGIVFWGALLALAFDWIPWLRGFKPWPPEWRWRYEPGQFGLGAAILFALGMGGLWVADRLARAPGSIRKRTIAFAFLYVLLFALQIGATATRSPRLAFLWAQRTSVNWLNGFFDASHAIDTPGEAWTRYDELAGKESSFPRLATHPPGLVSYYAAVRNGVESLGIGEGSTVAGLRRAIEPLEAAQRLSGTALAAMLLAALLQPLLANLALVPLFDLLRRQWNSATAIRTVALYATVPAVVLFVPAPDQFFLPLAAIALWGFCLGVDARIAPLGPEGAQDATDNNPRAELSQESAGRNRGENFGKPAAPISSGSIRPFSRRWIYLVIAGAAVAVHSLCGYHFTVPAAVFILWRVLLAWRDTSLGFRPRQAAACVLRDLAVFLLPLLLTWLFLWIAFRFSYIQHWLEGTGVHRAGITHNRSYAAWLVWNLWDVVLFLGLPAAAAVAWGVVRRRLWISPYVLALGVTLLAVDFSGAVRGETFRILMFLYPLLVPLAAPFLAGAEQGKRRFLLLGAHQLAQTACMALVLNLM